MERIWSTEEIPERERFAYWREVVTRAFVHLRPERTTGGPFWGEIRASDLADLMVADVRSGAQRVLRTLREIARSPHSVYFVNLQAAGTSGFCQAGHESQLEPGDLAIVDATRPFEMGFGAPFTHVSFKIPHHVLRPLLRRPDAAAGSVIRGREGFGALISVYARGAAEAARSDGHAVADGLVALLALALGAAADSQEAAAQGLRAARRQAAQVYLRRHLADPLLSPATAARALHVSTRYLHALFEPTEESVMRWVLRERLERCRADLADPGRRELSITEIAFAWGFGDFTHFGRAFRAAFGMSPRDWRQAAAARAEERVGKTIGNLSKFKRY